MTELKAYSYSELVAIYGKHGAMVLHQMRCQLAKEAGQQAAKAWAKANLG